MKSTGVVRKVDELGRIVIPIEIRRSHSMETGDPVEIYVEGDDIILRRKCNECVFCSGTRNLTELNGKYICSGCLKKLGRV